MAQQIKKKFIGADQIDGSKILLLDGQTLRKEDGLGGEIDVIANLEASVAAEEARALAAEGVLQGNIDNEKARIDAILDASQADKDSFAEIVTLINSVDTENDQAFAGYVLSNDAAVAAIDGRVTTNEGNISTLQSDVTDLENNKVENTGDTLTGSYEFQGAIGDKTNIAGGALNSYYTDPQGIKNEAGFSHSSIYLGYYDLQDNWFPRLPISDDEVTTKAYVDQEISALSSGGIAAVQSELDSTQSGAGLETDGSYLANGLMNYIGLATSLKNADELLDAQVKSNADGLAQEILDRIADVDAEEARALAAEATLQDNIDAEEARALSAEGVLQTNIDTVAANLAQEIIDRAADVDAEESRALAAESALDGRVSTLEAIVWYSEKFVVDATILSNGFVTLSNTPETGSVIANVDRLSIFEGAAEDFTMSGAVMTFLNQLVSPGQQALQVGDEIRVKYRA